MAAAKYKDNKPEMEKRRRSRINESISCLKLLVLGEVRRKNTRISKLDKADILEMAVEYLQKMNVSETIGQLPGRPYTGAADNHRPTFPPKSKIDRYRAGFNECAEEVRRHLADAADVDVDVRTRIVDHLANFVQNLQWLRRHDILPYDIKEHSNGNNTSFCLQNSGLPSISLKQTQLGFCCGQGPEPRSQTMNRGKSVHPQMRRDFEIPSNSSKNERLNDFHEGQYHTKRGNKTRQTLATGKKNYDNGPFSATQGESWRISHSMDDLVLPGKDSLLGANGYYPTAKTYSRSSSTKPSHSHVHTFPERQREETEEPSVNECIKNDTSDKDCLTNNGEGEGRRDRVSLRESPPLMGVGNVCVEGQNAMWRPW